MAEENKEQEQKATEEQTTEEQTEEKTEETTEAPAEEKQEESKEEEEKTEEAPAEDTEDEGEEVEVPEKFQDIVKQIEEMPVLELNELVKVFEKKFGVSAAAVAAAPGGGAGGGDEAEAKSSFDVELSAAGDQKIQVIKAVKELLGLGLKEAKDMVEGAPAVLKEGVAKEEAEEMKAKLEEVGGKVELK